jgi:ankyrin repeat protein
MQLFIQRLFSVILTIFCFLSPQVSGNDELRAAMIFNDWDKAFEIIAKNAGDLDPNIPMVEFSNEYNGVSALVFAIYKGQTTLAQKLLAKCPNVELKDAPVQLADFSTPLWHATNSPKSDPDLVAEIFARSPTTDVNARPTKNFHSTVLLNLARRNFPLKIKKINDEQYNATSSRPEPDFNASYTDAEYAGTTPLWWLANHRHQAVFSEIIRTPRSYSYNFDAAPSQGESVFNLVTKNQWWEDAYWILKNFAVDVVGNKNINGDAPLRRAIEAKQWQVVAELMKQLPDSVKYEYQPRNPYYYPQELSIFSLLLKHGKYDECADLLDKIHGQIGSQEFRTHAGYLAKNQGPYKLETTGNMLLALYFSLRGGQAPYTDNGFFQVFSDAATLSCENQNETNLGEKRRAALDYIKENITPWLGEKFTAKILEVFEGEHKKIHRQRLVDGIAKEIGQKIEAENKNRAKSLRFEYCPGCKVGQQINELLINILAEKEIPNYLLQERREILIRNLLALPDEEFSEDPISEKVMEIFSTGTNTTQG